MRVLFDQATPVPIRAYLEGHDVRTAAQQGWDTLKNGELLAAAEADGFDVLLTTDKNMPYQQNLAGRKIAVVVLGLQRWPSLRPNVRRVVEAIKARYLAAIRRSSFRRSRGVPIPNTEVKPRRADCTARESVWESFGFTSG
jgi:hypothetical protein